MTAWGEIRLIAGRQLADRMHGRALWIATGLAALLALAAIVLPAALQGTTTTRIGIVGPNARVPHPPRGR